MSRTDLGGFTRLLVFDQGDSHWIAQNQAAAVSGLKGR